MAAPPIRPRRTVRLCSMVQQGPIRHARAGQRSPPGKVPMDSGMTMKSGSARPGPGPGSALGGAEAAVQRGLLDLRATLAAGGDDAIDTGLLGAEGGQIGPRQLNALGGLHARR